MTREEQIDWLCRLRADLNNGVFFTPWNKEFTEALNDVLEQEPFINKPCVSSGACEHDKNKVLDKIRAEIERKANSGQWSEAVVYGMKKSIAIIDKYQAESDREVVENEKG